MRELRPSDRDLRVVQLLHRLPFATSAHVHALVFPGLTKKPVERCLNRLTKLGYLDRTERRPLGGTRGGSAFYIYRLGRRGWWLLNDGPFKVRRQPVEHSLAIADVVVILRQLETSGLQVNNVLTEPDCHYWQGDNEPKPDMFIDLSADGQVRMAFIEMDMATQGRKRILSKFRMYIRAADRITDDELRRFGGIWPMVLFIAIDDERKRELLYLLTELDDGDRSMFRVTTRAELSALLMP